MWGWCLTFQTLPPSSEVHVMSVAFTHYIYTNFSIYPSLDNVRNSESGSNILPQNRPHGEQFVDHHNSCCKSLALPYNVCSSQFCLLSYYVCGQVPQWLGGNPISLFKLWGYSWTSMSSFHKWSMSSVILPSATVSLKFIKLCQDAVPCH
jgi:hypothetical protein